MGAPSPEVMHQGRRLKEPQPIFMPVNRHGRTIKVQLIPKPDNVVLNPEKFPDDFVAQDTVTGRLIPLRPHQRALAYASQNIPIPPNSDLAKRLAQEGHVRKRIAGSKKAPVFATDNETLKSLIDSN